MNANGTLNPLHHQPSRRVHIEPRGVASERCGQSERDRFILTTVRRKMGDEMADRLAERTESGPGIPVGRAGRGESR